VVKQELVEANLEWKTLALSLLADFIAITGEKPTKEQQVIIDRYNEAIERCDSNIKYLAAN
jgi:hypothetical protein